MKKTTKTSTDKKGKELARTNGKTNQEEVEAVGGTDLVKPVLKVKTRHNFAKFTLRLDVWGIHERPLVAEER